MPCPAISRSRIRCTIAAAIWALSLACARAAPPEPDAGTKEAPARKSVELAAHGARFDVPVTWNVTHGPQGYTVIPPKGAPTEGLTLVFQALDGRGPDGKAPTALAVKSRLLDELKTTDPEGRLLRTVTFNRDGALGLRMETAFAHQGQNWRKDQLLVNHADQMLSLSYNGSEQLFASGLKVWEQVQSSLRFFAPVSPPAAKDTAPSKPAP